MNHPGPACYVLDVLSTDFAHPLNRIGMYARVVRPDRSKPGRRSSWTSPEGPRPIVRAPKEGCIDARTSPATSSRRMDSSRFLRHEHQESIR